jgi:hypothetical protein
MSDGYHTDPFKVLSVVNDQGLTQSLVHKDRPTQSAPVIISIDRQGMPWIVVLQISPIYTPQRTGILTLTRLTPDLDLT